MRKFVLTTNALIFILSILAEFSGYGLITRLRTDAMYDVIAVTQAEWLFVALYFIFFIILPALTLVALLYRREMTLPLERV